VRATWAPRGKTPVLVHHFNWKRLSMAAALAYAPDGSDATLVFSMRPGSYNDESLIVFLNELHELLDGDKVTLIWDGLPSHRSRVMQAFVKRARRWLVVERLPAYGHDLNPVEQVWGSVKGRELANLCPDSIDEAAQTADTGLLRISADAPLCFAFLRHCGLFL
jgi:transposase